MCKDYILYKTDESKWYGMTLPAPCWVYPDTKWAVLNFASLETGLLRPFNTRSASLEILSGFLLLQLFLLQKDTKKIMVQNECQFTKCKSKTTSASAGSISAGSKARHCGGFTRSCSFCQGCGGSGTFTRSKTEARRHQIRVGKPTKCWLEAALCHGPFAKNLIRSYKLQYIFFQQFCL